MAYYTERNGLRESRVPKEDISAKEYEFILHCCLEYCESLVLVYPKSCPICGKCCGVNMEELKQDLLLEIPNLYRDFSGSIVTPPADCNNQLNRDYQYALLDFIEFVAKKYRPFVPFSAHERQHFRPVMQNDILSNAGMAMLFASNNKIDYNLINVGMFRERINHIFEETGLCYTLTKDKIIERVVEFTPLSDKIEADIAEIPEKKLRELILMAVEKFKSKKAEDNQIAVEKMWAALERLKTYIYPDSKHKKQSAQKLVNRMATERPEFEEIFDSEFKKLSDIGNNFQIRHYEMDKIEITDKRHYDYFFNRCLSLIALAIQYLED